MFLFTLIMVVVSLVSYLYEKYGESRIENIMMPQGQKVEELSQKYIKWMIRVGIFVVFSLYGFYLCFTGRRFWGEFIAIYALLCVPYRLKNAIKRKKEMEWIKSMNPDQYAAYQQNGKREYENKIQKVKQFSGEFNEGVKAAKTGNMISRIIMGLFGF